MAVGPSFAELGVTTLDAQLCAFVAGNLAPKRYRFRLRVAPCGQALVPLSANAPAIAVADHILIFVGDRFYSRSAAPRWSNTDLCSAGGTARTSAEMSELQFARSIGC